MDRITVMIEAIGVGKTITQIEVNKYQVKNLAIKVKAGQNVGERSVTIVQPHCENTFIVPAGQDILNFSTVIGGKVSLVKTSFLPSYNELTGNYLLPTANNPDSLKPTVKMQVSGPVLSKEMEVVHYSDSRHGWVAVKRETLQAWGLADKISSCSYQSKAGGTIYLEEDGDATLFFKEAEARGYKVSVTEKDTTVVRGYPRYQP